MTDHRGGPWLALGQPRRVVASGPWLVAPISVAGLLLAAISVAIAARVNQDPWWAFVVAETIGLSFQLCGLFVWLRQEGAWAGPLMFLGGTAWYLGNLQYSGNEVLYGLGYWLYYLPLVMFCHLVLVYPTGRLEPRSPDRTIVIIAYTAYLALQGLRYVFERDLGPIGWQAPLHHSAWANALSVLALLLTLTTLLRLLRRRWLRSRPARPSHRTVWLVLIGIGIVLITDTVASIVGVDRRIQTALFFVYGVGLVCLPAAFAVGVLRERVLIADIVEALEPATDLHAVRTILAGKLDDVHLEIGLWSPKHGQYFDYLGQTVELPLRQGQLEVREERWNGEPLAFVAYDAALIDQPRLMGGVLAITRLVLVRIRQINDLHEQQERVLRAVFEERDRIARRLHDAVQYRLLGLAAIAGQVTAIVDSPRPDRELAGRLLGELQTGADATRRTLRETVQGIFPAILVARGLAAAIDEMSIQVHTPVFVDLPTQRFPAVIEATAYFGVAGALANALDHSNASAVTITGRITGDLLTITVQDDGVGGAAMRPGGGLSTSADQIKALRGTFTIHSPIGQGTIVTMELPCA